MKNWLKFALTSSLLIQLFGCSRPQIVKDRYAEANWNDRTANSITIDVFATNNFAGNLKAQTALYPDNTPSPIMYGGAPLLISYRTITQERSEANSLWLDVGGVFDPLGDSIHHKVTAHALKRIKYDALAFTEKELAVVGTKLPTEQSTPFINSNLIDLVSATSFESDKIKPWRIVEKAGKKLGVIAVTGYNEIKREAPDKTRGLYFEDMVLGILRAKKELARKVDATILLAHVDSACHQDSENVICPEEGDALKKLLLRLPPGAIDLVIASPNRILHGRINDIPVIMSPGLGHWLSRAQLIFGSDGITVETLSPLRVCDKFYHETGDCHIPVSGERTEKARVKLLKETANEMRAAKFWGHEVIADDKFESEAHSIRTQGN